MSKTISKSVSKDTSFKTKNGHDKSIETDGSRMRKSLEKGRFSDIIGEVGFC